MSYGVAAVSDPISFDVCRQSLVASGWQESAATVFSRVHGVFCSQARSDPYRETLRVPFVQGSNREVDSQRLSFQISALVAGLLCWNPELSPP